MCPKCVSWYHLRSLERCLGVCDNSIADWRFWKTVDNYYSLSGKRTPMCSIREATSVTAITKFLSIISITIKIVINLDENHCFFSVSAHWSDQDVTNKLVFSLPFFSCAFLCILVVLRGCASRPKQITHSEMTQTNTSQWNSWIRSCFLIFTGW